MYNKRGKSMLFFPKNHRGQITIFIIIAIIIIGVVVGFLFLREKLGIVKIPASIEPVYNSFLACLEDKTKVGIGILESQAGYIELPDFEPGNRYMPFSSQLNFLGNPIPYWYYVSGNNIQKEQVPSQQDMEKSLGNFINEKIRECNYDNYYNEGFEIVQEEPKASVSIKNDNVVVRLNMNLKISKGEDTALIKTHQITVKSNLGELYNSAKKIYQKEQKELFLENYGIDVLRLYAPVDGVDITCSPKTWDADEIFDDLRNAIETNTLALSTKNPATKEEKYFFVNADIKGEARFINSKNWSNSFEVLPSEESLLIANPVGNQPGLGVLGFCYVPYHFVYNIKYPVLIQIFDGEEIFQFPVAVVIQGNKPRTALNTTANKINVELCQYKNTPITVMTYDTNLNPVESQISYECFGQSCDIGETSSGTLTREFPQCVNGFIIARADGFKEARYQFSTTQSGSASIIMDKLYDLNVALKLDGMSYNGKAVVYFNSEGNSKVISYPEQKKVELSEGQYEILVYIYKDASIQLKETTTEQCMNVPSGIGGLLGITQKKCFDIKIPAQILSNVLAGGGKQDYYILESDLKNSKTIEINSKGFPLPTTIEQLQNNYLIFDSTGLEVNFR
jgi:hypothetical protein